MKNLLRKLLVFCEASLLCSLLPYSLAFSQQLTEQITIPSLLQTSVISEFISGQHGSIFITGTADSGKNSIMGESGIRVPYVIFFDSNRNASIHVLPDTGYFYYQLYDYHNDNFDLKSTSTDTGIVLFYSKQHVETSDIPPAYYSPAAVVAVKVNESRSGADTIFTDINAANPNLKMTSDRFIHFVWERRKELPGTMYTFQDLHLSAIYYRYLDNLGNLSAPQFVDSGYFPQIRVDANDSLHLLWFTADSSTSGSFMMKYITGKNGVFNQPLVFGPLHSNPSRSSFNYLVSNNGSVARINWIEDNLPPRAGAYSVRVENGQIYLDSLVSFFNTYLPSVFFLFRENDGATFAVWNSQDSDSILNYSSSLNGSLFSSSKKIHLNALGYASGYFINPKNGFPTLISRHGGSGYELHNLEAVPDNGFISLQNPQSYTGPISVTADSEVFMLLTSYTSNSVLIRFLDALLPVHENPSIAAKYHLDQNYPNPFNPATTIRYQLPENAKVSLKIYNVLGQEVATLVNGTQSAGLKEARFDVTNLGSGIYFYRIQAGSFNDIKKMVVVK